HPDQSDMEAHCPSRAGGQGWRLSATGGLVLDGCEYGGTVGPARWEEAFHNRRFPFAGSGHAKTIRSSRTGARSQDPAIMRLSVALRYFQKSPFYLLRDRRKVWSIRCIDVC